METKYIFKELTENKKGELYSIPYSDKKTALAAYSKMCEDHPQKHFRVLKRQTIEDVIAESDDYRQAKFAFAN